MNESLEDLFGKLWRDYAAMNKQAGKIHQALEARSEKVVNDHVAFRTFDISRVGIEVLAKPFLNLGYKLVGDDYQFKEKKLIARHYEHGEANRPKVFISALKVNEFSKGVQKVICDLADPIPDKMLRDPDFLISGAPWKRVSWKTYSMHCSSSGGQLVMHH